MVTSPGETIDAVISANAVTDDNDSLRFIESAIFDFTPLRQLEVERERLARVVDATSDLISLASADGTIRYANSAARAWFRQHVTDAEYVHLAQPIADDDAAMLAKALEVEGSWVGVLTVPGRQGIRTVSVSLQAIQMRGELTIASISRDVTTEIETEKQLKDLIRAKDELVASISHEIRTPLSVVLGLASEVRDNYETFDRGTHREFAALIAEQGQEMANIVEDLLVAARADTGSIVLAPIMVDINEEVEMSLRALPDQSRGLRVTNQAAGTCWADASRVRQILRNLISNAARYGGDQVTISAEQRDGLMALAVADSGTGVSNDEIATIFEPFGRAHAKGTQPNSIGLGLSVSRDLARRMGGDLVYSRDRGTTVFTLTLPAEAPVTVGIE
jgi:signal transduction histidine kinase